MVTAERAGRIIRVSKSAYNSIFKNKGYRIISDDADKMKTDKKVFEEDNKAEKVVEVEGEPEEVETEEEIEDIDNIPVSEMNKQQLMEYAKKHNIDTSSATSVAQARKMIQREIRNRNM